MSDIVGDLEAMDAGKPAPNLPPRGEKGKFTAKPKDETKPPADETKPPADATKRPEDATRAPEDATKPTEGEKPGEGRPMRMRELGERYDQLKKQVETDYRPKIQRLEAQLAELQKSTEASPAVTARIKALEERNASLEQHMQFVDYSQSEEYRTKYQEPYRNAWNEALAEFKELTITDPETGSERAADQNDLLTLANMKLSEMDRTATEMFGASAARAIGHIQNLKKLSAAQNKALDDARTRAGEMSQRQKLEMEEKLRTSNTAWTEINKSLQEKFPKAFAVEEGNEADKAGHTKGFALADLLFLGEKALSPEQIEALPPTFRETVKAGKPLSDLQRVQLHALARLKMANHDRNIVRVKVLQDKVAELEKALKEFEDSEPGEGRTSRAPKAGEKDWLETAESELQAMDK